MKKANLWIIALVLLIGCNSSNSQAQRLVTIKYCLEPMGTFEITGTNVRGIELRQLAETLKRYKSANLNTEYELLSEVKCTPEGVQDIKKAFKDAGIKLNRFWAPVSDTRGQVDLGN